MRAVEKLWNCGKIGGDTSQELEAHIVLLHLRHPSASRKTGEKLRLASSDF
jgi:hypothetical protein